MKFLSSIVALVAVANLAHADSSAAPQPTSAPIPTYPISRDCGVGNRYFQNVTDFTIIPSDFCVGKNYAITLTGPLSGPIIRRAKFSIVGRYLNRVVYTDQVHELCQSLTDAGTPCPVAASTTSWSIQRQLKMTTMSHITTRFEFSATNGEESPIFCRTTNLKAALC